MTASGAVGHCDAVWAAELHEVGFLSIPLFFGIGIGGVARVAPGSVPVGSVGGLELEIVVDSVVGRNGLLIQCWWW